MINEFSKLLTELLKVMIDEVGLLSSSWDQKSYASVVKCLLLRDEIAVKEAVDHLILEGKELAIPPIYLASQRHPKLSVRQYCWGALQKFSSYHRITEIIDNKELKASLDRLIQEYGHYKDNYY